MKDSFFLSFFYEFELVAFQMDDTETNVTVHAPSMSLISRHKYVSYEDDDADVDRRKDDEILIMENHKRISSFLSYWNNCSDSDEYERRSSFLFLSWKKITFVYYII